MSRMHRGWQLTKKSWSVLRSNRSLPLFPILSAIFIVIAAAIIWGPAVALIGTDGFSTSHPSAAVIALLVVSGYVATTLAVYFNVALAACAARAMDGAGVSVGEGMDAANQRLGSILAWSALATTVGFVLRFIEEQFRLAGAIASWILGAAWGIASFFAIPAIAWKDAGRARP